MAALVPANEAMLARAHKLEMYSHHVIVKMNKKVVVGVNIKGANCIACKSEGTLSQKISERTSTKASFKSNIRIGTNTAPLTMVGGCRVTTNGMRNKVYIFQHMRISTKYQNTQMSAHTLFSHAHVFYNRILYARCSCSNIKYLLHHLGTATKHERAVNRPYSYERGVTHLAAPILS